MAEALVRLRRQGWSQVDIGRTYGVTQSAVWKALNRAGYTDPRPTTYRDVFPYQVEARHTGTSIMERLRSLAKQRAGLALEEEEEVSLKRWLDALEENGVVVAYHPDAPPNSASQKGGFYFTPRKPEDEWIFRVPEKGGE